MFGNLRAIAAGAALSVGATGSLASPQVNRAGLAAEMAATSMMVMDEPGKSPDPKPAVAPFEMKDVRIGDRNVKLSSRALDMSSPEDVAQLKKFMGGEVAFTKLIDKVPAVQEAKEFKADYTASRTVGIMSIANGSNARLESAKDSGTEATGRMFLVANQNIVFDVKTVDGKTMVSVVQLADDAAPLLGKRGEYVKGTLKGFVEGVMAAERGETTVAGTPAAVNPGVAPGAKPAAQQPATLAPSDLKSKLEGAKLMRDQLSPETAVEIKKTAEAYLNEVNTGLRTKQVSDTMRLAAVESGALSAEEAGKMTAADLPKVKGALEGIKDAAAKLGKAAASHGKSTGTSVGTSVKATLEDLQKEVPYAVKYDASLKAEPPVATQRHFWERGSTEQRSNNELIDDCNGVEADMKAIDQAVSRDIAAIRKGLGKGGVTAEVQTAAVRLGMSPTDAVNLKPEQINAVIDGGRQLAERAKGQRERFERAERDIKALPK